MAERLPAQDIVVAEFGCEARVQARPCATIDGSALDECATLAVNDSCCSRKKLDGDAPGTMPMDYIEIENITAG